MGGGDNMKIQVMSDLHFGHHKDNGVGFINDLDPTGVDVLILAGDISDIRNCHGHMGMFCKKFPHVVFTPGNHAYYGTSFDRANNEFARIAADVGNFHYLNNDTVTVDGQRFVGTTLWFPDGPTNSFMKRGLNDFFCIKNFESIVYEENKKAVDFLNNTVKYNDVVLTHHLPSPECVADYYRHGLRSGLNIFYVCDMTNLILSRQPKLWVHGHGHTRKETMIGNTRITCNPLGYPREQSGYEERLIIEV